MPDVQLEEGDAPPRLRGFPRMPLLTALGAQAIAGLRVFGGDFALSGGAIFSPPLIGLLVLQGLLAAALSHFLGLAPWWGPIQLALPASLAWASLPAL